MSEGLKAGHATVSEGRKALPLATEGPWAASALGFRLILPILTLLLLGLFSLTPTIQAQEPLGTVVVRVISESEPVEGAEVRAGSVQAFTSQAGEARLTLPAGEAEIQVRRIGFASASIRVLVVAGEDTVVEVELDHEALEMDEITVGLTRIGRRVQDEPLRVEVLGREEIEEKMLMTPGNIVMLLNETGGLRVQTTSPSLGAANIRVQGMRGRYTQLLADGLPLYGGQAGSIGLMQIPPMDLGQIEVVKGVASALYGASALGGVVNLISRRPAEEPAAELLLNATTQNGQDATLYLSGPLSPAWGYSLLGGAHRQEIQDLDGTGWADLAAFRRGSVRPRLFWDGGDGKTALFTVGAMWEDRDGGTLPGRTVPDGTSFAESLRTRRGDAGVTASYPLGQGRFLQLRASGMLQRHHHTFGDVLERDRHGTLFGEAAVAGGGAVHAWVWGLALQHDDFRSETHPSFDYRFSVPALFAQHEVRFSQNVITSLSARWDWHSEYGSHLSPRVSALYRPGEWTFRASLGSGFFAPTPFVEEIEAAGLSRLQPLDGLSSERARTASVDAGRTIGPFELNGTLFASRVDNAVQLVPTEEMGSRGPRVRLMNVEGDTRTSGAEALVRYRRENVSLTGSYVFVRATEPSLTASSPTTSTGEAASPGQGVPQRRAVPLTPKHTAGLVAMWEDHDRGILGVEAYFTGRQSLNDNPYRSEGRAQVHLGVLGELRRGSWSVFVNAENLLDVRQTKYDPLIRNSRAPDGRWTVDAWAPVDGFAVNGGVRIRFGM